MGIFESKEEESWGNFDGLKVGQQFGLTSDQSKFLVHNFQIEGQKKYLVFFIFFISFLELFFFVVFF